jgi:hypothetical protein
MDDNWITVYSTNQLYKAELVKELLFDNQVTAFVLNQQDSTYLFGEIEVCVKQGDVIRAKYIINKIEF